MTTLQITLPDDLASDAAKAGLLIPERFEQLLRAELRKEKGPRLEDIMEALSAIDGPAPMTPEDVADEIRIMRAERRRAKAA